MKPIKIAINGFGRIGRTLFKLAIEKPEIEIVAINDLGDLENLAYLLKYDSVYGRDPHEIKTKCEGEQKFLVVNDRKIFFLQEKDPLKLPWKDLNIDIAIEATGVFESFEKASAHLEAGAKRVIITAPAKDDDGSLTKGATVLMGINENDLAKVKISSNGSCTTNAVAPAMAVLAETVGIKKALLNTVHAYTASQKIVDGPDSKDWRRGRAGAINLVPSTTGAALAVTKVIKELEGVFDGIAIRTPVPVVSLADITFLSARMTTKEEINEIFRKAEKEARWQGILKTVEEPVVSSDLIKDPYPSIVDLSYTKVIGGDLVKILVWYDNEWGYSVSLLAHILKVSQYL